jgi:large subunit ribosomal protein L25
MADTVFHAERRAGAGKGAARAARRQGNVPGVIYGAKKPPALIAINPRELELELHRKSFFTNLYDVQLEGAAEKVLVRDVQLHPVSDKPVHIDFMRIDPNTKVTVHVPVVFENEAAAPGIKRGGVLNIVRHEIELVCLATQIPHEIKVDLTGLDIGDSVHISKIKLPEGVRPKIARDFTVATVAAPTTMAADVDETAAPVAATDVEIITAREGKEGAEGAPDPKAKPDARAKPDAKGKPAEAKKEAAKPDAKGKPDGAKKEAAKPEGKGKSEGKK